MSEDDLARLNPEQRIVIELFVSSGHIEECYVVGIPVLTGVSV
jgi:hypothetical protein